MLTIDFEKLSPTKRTLSTITKALQLILPEEYQPCIDTLSWEPLLSEEDTLLVGVAHMNDVTLSVDVALSKSDVASQYNLLGFILRTMHGDDTYELIFRPDELEPGPDGQLNLVSLSPSEELSIKSELEFNDNAVSKNKRSSKHDTREMSNERIETLQKMTHELFPEDDLITGDPEEEDITELTYTNEQGIDIPYSVEGGAHFLNFISFTINESIASIMRKYQLPEVSIDDNSVITKLIVTNRGEVGFMSKSKKLFSFASLPVQTQVEVYELFLIEIKKTSLK